MLTDVSIDTEDRIGIILTLLTYYKLSDELSDDLGDIIKWYKNTDLKSFNPKHMSIEENKALLYQAMQSLALVDKAGNDKKEKATKHIKKGENIVTAIFSQFADNNANINVFIDDLYQATQKYSTGRTKGASVVLTPPHLARFMNELLDVKIGDVVLDPCAGSGALTQQLSSKRYVKTVSVEYNSDMFFVLAVKKLLTYVHSEKTAKDKKQLLSDEYAKTLIQGDFFSEKVQQLVMQQKPNKAIINPPFHFAHNGLDFASDALDMLAPNSLCAVVTTTSSGFMNGEFFDDLLAKHTLISVTSLNNKAFIGASVFTQVYLFKAKVPHTGGKNSIQWIDWVDDKVKRTRVGDVYLEDFETTFQQVVEKAKHSATVKDNEEVEKLNTSLIVPNVQGEPSSSIDKTLMQSLISGYETAKSGSIFGRQEEEEDLISLSQGDGIEFKQFKIGEIFDFHITQKPNHKLQKAKKVPMISATMKDNGVYDVVDADNVYRCEQLFCITKFAFISYQGFHDFVLHSNNVQVVKLHDGLIEKDNHKAK